jgi:hypothetical protein
VLAETSELVPVLQTAVGPVVMISGVGLLLLSMTNRLGRIVDRSRSLARQVRETTDEDRGPIQAQLRILGQRAQVVRRAIALASFCVLFAAVLVISLFVTAASTSPGSLLGSSSSAWVVSSPRWWSSSATSARLCTRPRSKWARNGERGSLGSRAVGIGGHRPSTKTW